MAFAGALACAWRVALVGASVAALAPIARAQAPDEARPVRLVVPAPAGTSADKVAEIVAVRIAPLLGRPVAVEHNVDGGMVGGLNAIAAALPDGNTLGLAVSTAMIGGRLLARGARYNPTEDFAWLAILGSYTNAMVVAAREPARSLREWIEAKRKAARPLVAGVYGPGSAGHLAASFLRVEQGVPIAPRYVDTLSDPYALLGSGEIDLLFDGAPNAVEDVKRTGHRVLAVTSQRPIAAFPRVPAFGATWPGVSYDIWLGLVAPKGLNEFVRARLATAAASLVADPGFVDALRAAGVQPIGLVGEPALAFVEDDVLRVAGQISRLRETTAPAR